MLVLAGSANETFNISLTGVGYKGVLFKTWEGEISQGINGAHIFQFTVLDEEANVVEKCKSIKNVMSN
jgi:hypothetical protein